MIVEANQRPMGENKIPRMLFLGHQRRGGVAMASPKLVLHAANAHLVVLAGAAPLLLACDRGILDL